MNFDQLVNDFAIRSFRDQGDADYIAARMAYRARLVTPSLWASQQTIEKYLKCILLLNRIPADHVKHDLGAALDAINASSRLALDLMPPVREFIDYVNSFGTFRYLEVSNFAFGGNLVMLDRTAWDLRRYCTLSRDFHGLRIRTGETPTKVRILGGYLEQVIADPTNPARAPLLWRNAFFGVRQRRRVGVDKWLKATNSPLYLNPQILDEVLKYVYLPRDVVKAYRSHKKP
jgi:hypothetical protein